MKITVIGRHLDIGDSLRQHAEDQVNEIAKKYFVDPISAQVIITKETRSDYTVNLSVQLGSGVGLEAEETTDDVYAAFDAAVKTMGKRLVRYKDRLKDHHKRAPVHEVVANYLEIDTHDEDEAEGGMEPAIIAETAFKIQTLAVADAVMLLELSQAPAMMFKNPGNGRLNMVYRRKDGHIGWVDPEYTDLSSSTHVAKAPTKKAVAKKAPAKKAVVKKSTPAKKPVAKKAPAKKMVAKKTVAKKAPVKKAPAKKATSKKKK